MLSNKEIEKRFIAYRIRGLNIKPWNKSPFSESAYNFIKEFLDSINMKIVDSLFGFTEYAISNLSSKEAFIFIQMYNYLAFILDDYLEKHIEDYEKFVKYVKEGKCEGNTEVEKFLEFYFKQSKQLVSEEFLRQHNQLFLEWLQYFPERYHSKHIGFTDEEFFKWRVIDAHTTACLFIYTLDCGLKMTDDIKDNEDYIGVFDEVSKHGVLVNDIFSFVKESEAGVGKFNYFHYKMMNNNMTVEEAMDQIVLEINESERKAHYYANKLMNSNNESLANYAKKVTNIMYGNAYWSSITKRYKNPEYKFWVNQ